MKAASIMKTLRLPAWLLVLLPAGALPAADVDEFRVKRQEVFAFAEPPVVRREGDRVTIRFASKGYCDATVAIEDGSGRIVRHLACGVLGEEAPPPFRKRSLVQAIVWDGKDDAGRYLDHKERLTVRVSLGLRARLERTLYWHPGKRVHGAGPVICPTKEGVYVYEGGEAMDHVRLFDHQGGYLRTLYPFGAGTAGKVRGLLRHSFPQDDPGAPGLPVKLNFLQTTLLASGDSAVPVTYKAASRTYESVAGKYPQHFGMGGCAATAMAVGAGRVALAYWKTSRFATDGTSGGMTLHGPTASFTVVRGGPSWRGGGQKIPAGATSAAVSPDGKWLYLAGFTWPENWDTAGMRRRWLHGVARMRLDGDEPPQVFAGSLKQGDAGTDDRHFRVPACVACDASGRVYVADYMNDRIQVFEPDGTLRRTIRAPAPAWIAIDPRRNEICVFTWLLGNRFMDERTDRSVPARLTRLGPLENPKVLAACELPLPNYTPHPRSHGVECTGYRAALDPWTDPPTIWAAGPPAHGLPPRYAGAGIRLFALAGGKLVLKRDFAAEAAKAVAHLVPATHNRRRLYVNPATGRVYVGEGQWPDGTGRNKAFDQLLEIDPETGAVKVVPLPFNAEDMCFGPGGLAYLRSRCFVGRYDPATWREVPWDYGENWPAIGFASGRGRRAEAVSALPVFEGINWHMGGMGISPRGHLAVSCYGVGEPETRKDEKHVFARKPYQPRLYPGRALGHYRALVHVWDRRGRLLHEDAIPGLPDCYGLAIDARDDLYVLTSGTRVLAGRRYFNDLTGTLMKFRPGRGRIVSAGEAPIALPPERRPKRPPDVQSALQGPAWVEGQEWLYGGVGYCGKNRGVGCSCFNTRFCLDSFARCFAPEMDRYSVAVLDSAGNVILRIGTYGNADDGLPLVKAGGPPRPRSIGGDEVALFHGAYLAAHTDRRLFVADPGNARVLAVRLDYHRTARVALGAEGGGAGDAP